MRRRVRPRPGWFVCRGARPGAYRGELLIITDQPDTATDAQDEVAEIASDIGALSPRSLRMIIAHATTCGPRNGDATKHSASVCRAENPNLWLSAASPSVASCVPAPLPRLPPPGVRVPAVEPEVTQPATPSSQMPLTRPGRLRRLGVQAHFQIVDRGDTAAARPRAGSLYASSTVRSRP